ncbi:MAG: ribosome silencing factor [Betaproteobacteria bacterium]|nr:ribosome silencing factor [Betaproteobacteria bacterium]
MDATQIIDLVDPTKALAWRVAQQVKAAGGEILAIEGEATGEWVLVDAGDAVVHIMQPAIRSYYRLEELWGERPVRMKLGAASVRSAAKTPL